MTVLWTQEDAQDATGGESLGPKWSASGVSIDTRTLRKGDLFVALKDTRDGHDFVAKALELGAAAALVSRVPDGVKADAPLLIVPDVLSGLEALSLAARARTKAKVIAITGSAGKTSTKDMTLHVLSKQGRTHAAEASYNNHWGVPLTLARMPADTEFAVIEIGMNHPGEIAPLSRMARPHIAVVTTVAAAHLEAFEGVENIAKEKAAIFQGLEPGGAALYNLDVETAPVVAAEAKRHAARCIGFGEDPNAELQAKRVILETDTSVVEAHFDGKPFLFKVGAPGRHFAVNALAVLGSVLLAGADPDLAALDMATWHAPSGRGKRETVQLDVIEGQSIEMIDDAFNANPASMAAALEVLSATTPEGKGRRIAILGDMLELGADEARLHAEIAELPSMNAIDRVDCVGPRMQSLFNALPVDKRGASVEAADELAGMASGLVRPGDVVLVKGSKGSKVSMVVEALKALETAQKKRAV